MDQFRNDDFQVINMNYKLKRIKKNKKQRNNYKNIDLLEVLDNKPNPESSLVEPFNTKIIEGLKLPDSAYDGIDNVNDNRDSVGMFDPISNLSSIINNIYDGCNYLNHFIATKLANVLSKDTASENDINLFRNNIVWFESVMMSCFVTYNLFFIMYYKDVEKIKLFVLSREKVNEAAKTNQLLYLLLFIFEYSIFFPEVLNLFLTTYIPKFTKQFFNATLIFAIIFVCLIFFFKYFAAGFKNFLIDGLQGQMGWIGYILTGIIGLLWLKSLVADIIKYFFDNNGVTMPMISIVFFFIFRLLRLMIAMSIGGATGIILMILYIICYVFMAVFIYKGPNTSIYERMDNYIRTATAEYVPNNCGDNGSIFTKIFNSIFWVLEYFMKLIDILHEHLFVIAFIVILIYGILKYNNNISVSNLKQYLISINGGLAILLALYVIKAFLSKISLKENTAENN